jgi:hypothetical protein
MTQHRVRTSATADGWTAACTCGWRTVRRTREQRDLDTDAHQLGNAVAQSEEATASDACQRQLNSDPFAAAES